MFELKKIVSSFMMPLPALLIIGFLGLFLIMFTSRRGTGCIFTFISLLGIFLLSFQPVATSLLKPTERQYTAFLPVEGSIDYVMVLGSGHTVDDEIPPTSELSRTGLMRLAEGIRILRMYPGAKLILSGYAAGSSVSNARMMANVAVSLGIAKADIILLESAKDTWEESHQAAGFVGNKRLVLVTSASHMQRALNDFHSADLDPIPAPTNYLAVDNINQAWERFTPQSKYLEQSERYWHEQLGRWWQVIRNSLSDEKTAVQPTSV
ncbi:MULTISPECIES: envelope biogenesis factor ElyC [Vibrio]|uniref:Envelope biogenesis factor ElyC n=1 Tax=Vibrio algicola TaxID=2662262 RepID=A0A5Q0TF88_9VIBR|nr:MULTISPECIES: envelope biogenesis factor ElyC [Vibrio]MBD1576720.1 envelope biogenesis factor ElyC [Vibrio sp. S11_S32]